MDRWKIPFGHSKTATRLILALWGAWAPAAWAAYPTAMPDSATTAEDTPVTINVTANDYDTDGQIPILDVVPISTNPTNGTVVKVSNTSLRYTPSANFFGSDTFRYRITDGTYLGYGTVTLTVNSVNDPPVAVADSGTTPAGSSLDLAVVANDTDVEGQPLALTASPIAVAPAHGTATRVSATVLRYSPAAGYAGPDSFQYDITDGNGGSARGLVTITVDANQAPIAVNDAANAAPAVNKTIVVTANDYDPNGDPVSLTAAPIVVAPVQGTATRLSATSIQYRTYGNFQGTDSFQYEVTDGRGRTARATVTVTVTNTAPVAVNDSATAVPNIAAQIVVTGNDYDPDGHNVSLTTNPIVVQGSGGTAVRTSATTVTYTPNGGTTSDSFQYEVQDPYGLRSRATVQVTVVNGSPVAANDNMTVYPYGYASVNVTANDYDPDGHMITLRPYPIVTPPQYGTALRLNANEIRYTAGAGYTSGDRFQYEIADSSGATARAWVYVSGPNRAPVAVDDTGTVAPQRSLVLNVVANDTDPDNQVLQLTTAGVVVAPTLGTASRISATEIRYTAGAGVGTDTFVYEIKDTAGLTDRGLVTITIANGAPLAVADQASLLPGQSIDLAVLANDQDPDGHSLSLTANPVVSAPTSGTATRLSSTVIRYTAGTQFTTDRFQYEMTDGLATARAWVDLSANNAPPVAVDDQATTGVGRPVTIELLANDSDPEGSALQLLEKPGVAQYGAVEKVSATAMLYTPNAGFQGTDSFTYQIRDAAGLTDTGLVTVTVANGAPVAADDTAATTSNQAVTLDVVANDTDPEGQTLSLPAAAILAGPYHGTAARISAREIRYVPATGFVGQDQFQYQVLDSSGASATARVFLDVTAPAIVLTSLTPDMIPLGQVTRVTMTGTNLTGVDVFFPIGSIDPADPRPSPLATVVNIAADGTSIQVDVDASHPDLKGFYHLVAERGADRKGLPLRVVPAGPVVDAYSPSEPESGSLNILQLIGVNLQGVEVSASDPRVRIFDVDNSADELTIGLIDIDPAVTGDFEIIVEHPAQPLAGKAAHAIRLPLRIAPLGESSKRSTNLRAQAAEGPALNVQELTLVDLGFQSEGSRVEGFCLTFHRSRSMQWQRVLAFDPTTQRIINVINRLIPGARIPISLEVYSIFAAVDTELRFACDYGLNGYLCVYSLLGVEVLGRYGQVVEMSGCIGHSNGGFLSRFTATTGGIFGSATFTASTGGAPSGGDCVRLNPLGPAPVNGLFNSELEALECCAENVPLRGSASGMTFNGYFFGGQVTLADQVVLEVPQSCTPVNSCDIKVELDEALVVKPNGLGKSLRVKLTNQSTFPCLVRWEITSTGATTLELSPASIPETLYQPLEVREFDITVSMPEISEASEEKRLTLTATATPEGGGETTSKTANSVVCAIPTGEESFFKDWSNFDPSADFAYFDAVLRPAEASFEDRIVKESEWIDFRDDCWQEEDDPGMRFSADNVFTGFQWIVNPGWVDDQQVLSLYGYHPIGYRNHNLDAYYAQLGQETPCLLSATQPLAMACPAPLEDQPYHQNYIEIFVDPGQGTLICRDLACNPNFH